MRIGYLDCFAGISGDMLLGALVDAGVPFAVLDEAARGLGLGASLRREMVDRSGICCVKVHVMEGDQLADGGVVGEPVVETGELLHSHGNGPAHSHGGWREGSAAPDADGAPAAPGAGRSLRVIRGLIEGAALTPAVKALAVRAFELLGAAEAKIHNVPVEEIHFHEVGGVDAMVDMVAASAGLVHLGVGAWYSSAVNVGGGMVRCAHGMFPVPAPATADLLRGSPTYSAHVMKELVTPTGAALLRALEPTFGPQPAMQVEAIGYGAGTRNPEGFPNVLRLSVGTSNEGGDEMVTVLETALDDLSPQVLAYVAERVLAAGALDVMQTPVVMKKGRAATLLTVLCDESKRAELELLLLRETTTLGVRSRRDRRVCLERSHVTVATEYGEVRMKIGWRAEEELNAAPEFEDCRRAAGEHGVALKLVQQAAIAAYRNRSAR